MRSFKPSYNRLTIEEKVVQEYISDIVYKTSYWDGKIVLYQLKNKRYVLAGMVRDDSTGVPHSNLFTWEIFGSYERIENYPSENPNLYLIGDEVFYGVREKEDTSFHYGFLYPCRVLLATPEEIHLEQCYTKRPSYFKISMPNPFITYPVYK